MIMIFKLDDLKIILTQNIWSFMIKNDTHNYKINNVHQIM